MKLCFELTMPNVGSWNGKWTGADKKYYHFREDQFIESGQRFLYDFGDGWTASVVLMRVTDDAAALMKEISAGFCGYEWMVDSILSHGEILADANNRAPSPKMVSGVKYLKIQNKGVLPIELVALMGGTTKAGQKYKIGQFGTGLKYTLAYLFRNNIAFHIFLGENRANIDTVVKKIADKDFEIIRINGEQTSITTMMGEQWTAWMIIRELWCNALDEGGNERSIVREDAIAPLADTTTFYIQITPEIQFVIDKWQSYFIQDRKPMWENDEYAIYPNNDGPLRLYKNGVLIYQHPDTPSLFLYDIKGATINELREFTGSTSFDVFEALRNPGQEVINYFLENITEKDYEGCELTYDWFHSFASIWENTVGNRKIARIGDDTYFSERGIDINFDNVIKLPKKVHKALTKAFSGIGALTQADDKSGFYDMPAPELMDNVREAMNLIRETGYQFDPGFTIKCGIFQEENLKSSVILKKKTLLLSIVCAKLPIPELICLLIENNEHIITGIDKSYAKFYQHFVRLFTRSLFGGVLDQYDQTTEETRTEAYSHDSKDDLPF